MDLVFSRITYNIVDEAELQVVYRGRAAATASSVGEEQVMVDGRLFERQTAFVPPPSTISELVRVPHGTVMHWRPVCPRREAHLPRLVENP